MATVANPSAGLWSVPILTDGVAEETDVKPFPLSTAQSSAPRFGADTLFYLSSLGAGDGVWRLDNGQSTEIWKGVDGSVLAPPDASRDGQRVALVLRRGRKLRLHVLAAEGGEIRALADSIDVRGGASLGPRRQMAGSAWHRGRQAGSLQGADRWRQTHPLDDGCGLQSRVVT